MSTAWQYTPKQYSKDLLVRHMATNHHSNGLYGKRQENFIKKIQINDNPSGQYFKKMKGLYMDQLDSGVQQHFHKKNRYITEMQQTRKDYQENINGVIAYLQKQQGRRNDYIKNCLVNQQTRANKYVDAFSNKNQKAEHLIRYNCQDPILLAKSQMLADEQTQNCKSSNINQYLPSINLHHKKSPSQNIYSLSQNSSKYNINLQNRKTDTKQNHTTNRIPKLLLSTQETGQNLTQKIKYDLYTLNNKNQRKVLRVHNPITNPIEYHIDNPYFIKKMQEKQEKK